MTTATAPTPPPSPPTRAPALEAQLREEAVFGRLPLLREEREYSTRGILATGFSYAVAAWCFLIGGFAATYVDAIQGMVTLIAGSVIGVALSSAAAAMACNRYGLEQIDYTKTAFGQHGAKLVLIFYVVNQVGWTGMILVMFGRGVMNVAQAFGFQGGESLVRVAVVLGLLAAYVVVVRGVHVLNVFNAVITPGLLLATAFLFYAICRDGGWQTVLDATPIQPTGERALDNIIAFELGLGAGFSWWPGIGFLARNTDTQRNSVYPQILTMGLGMGVVCCTGLFAGLAFQASDPTEWLIQAGGRGMGTAVLVLLGVANLSASAIMMYTAALGLRHVRVLRALPWKLLVALAFLPVLAYAVAPELLYEKGNAFLTYNATMFAPISGILLVDYFPLRRERINVSQVFEDHPSGHYWFTRGFNVVALVAMLVGQVLYVWLLNPVSLETHGPVRSTTASAPAFLVPTLFYAVATWAWGTRRGLGGYGAPTEALPLKQPNL
ncbi:MAG: cytosine permease [Myxococcota bacterium]